MDDLLPIPVGPLVNDQTGRLRIRFGTEITPVRFLTRMRSSVRDQYRRVRKGLGTVVTLKRFLSGVCPFVSGEHRQAREGLVAYFTWIQSILPVVFGRVSGHSVEAGKRLGATVTLERLVGDTALFFFCRVRNRFGPLRHTAVRAPVTVQTGLLGERLVANFTRVRFVPGVQHFMLPQTVGEREQFMANVTFIRFFLSVSFFMVGQIRGVRKRFLA